jgi:hypothetical protein
MKIDKFKCTVKLILPERKNKDTRIQEVILFRKGWTDEFGDQKGKDQYYKVAFFNNDIEKFSITQYANKKVEVNLFLNGFEYTTQTGMEYGLQLVLKAIKSLEDE